MVADAAHRYTAEEFQQDSRECRDTIGRHYVGLMQKFELGDSEHHAISDNPASSVSKLSYQFLLVSTAERLSNHLHSLSELVSNSTNLGRQSLALSVSSEVIPTLYTLTYLTTVSCQDITAAVGSTVKQELLTSCIVLATSLLDCLDLLKLSSPETSHNIMLNGLRKAVKVNLRQNQRESISSAVVDDAKQWNKMAQLAVRSFHLFLDRIQKTETILGLIGTSRTAHNRVLDLRMDVAQAFGSHSAVPAGTRRRSSLPELLGLRRASTDAPGFRRASRKSLGEIVYPNVFDQRATAPPLPDQISAKWDVRSSNVPMASTSKRAVSTIDPFQNVLPVELAHGLLTRKISLPPPYDQINAQLEFLNAMSRVSGSEVEFTAISDPSIAAESPNELATFRPEVQPEAAPVLRKEGFARIKVGGKGVYTDAWLDLAGSRLIAWRAKVNKLKSGKTQPKKKEAIACLDISLSQPITCSDTYSEVQIYSPDDEKHYFIKFDSDYSSWKSALHKQ
jgi:hypothetical protein